MRRLKIWIAVVRKIMGLSPAYKVTTEYTLGDARIYDTPRTKPPTAEEIAEFIKQLDGVRARTKE